MPSVESVLAHRHAVAARPRRAGAFLSLLLHAGLVATVLVTPLLSEADQEPPRFVSVALVSSQALGVRNPAPPRPEPAAPEPRRVEPEPARPEPEPEPARVPAPSPARPASTERAAETPSRTEPARNEIRRREGSPTGSSTGTAALGARVGFDNPNFKHSYFVDRLTAMLAAQWRRPALGGDLVALVHFTIHRDGTVSDARIVESSGYSSYDLAALRAVQQAAPFPPLPQSYDQATLGVTVEFI